MKQVISGRNLYMVVMLLCFLYAGFSVYTFVSEMNAIARAEFVDRYLYETFDSGLDTNLGDVLSNDTGASDQLRQSIVSSYYYRNAYFALAGAIIGFLAGVSILLMLQSKSDSEARQDVLDVALTDDEKHVVENLKSSGGIMTQSELVKASGLTKVKIHRVIKRLEALGIVSKYPHGMTNKIKLQKK